MNNFFRLCRSRHNEAQKEIGNRQSAIGNHLGCGRILTFLSAFMFAANIFAADVTAEFSAANKLYAQGKYADAAAGYEKIMAAGTQSPALLFNYANAEFKAGHLGHAIAAYRRTRQWSPRDDEIRANLAFVRNQVQGATVREGRWRSWLGSLSLNEWTLLGAGAFWLVFLLLAAGQIRPALSPKLRSLTRWAVVVLVFIGAGLSLQVVNHFSRQTAVVISAEVTARSGPFDEAQNAFTARDGAELRVLDHHDDWVQVADGAGKIGWLNRKQVDVLPGA